MVAHAVGCSNRVGELGPKGRRQWKGSRASRAEADSEARLRRRDLLCHSRALQSIHLYSRRSVRRAGGEAPVGQRQPLRQLPRGLVRRRTVKRHHRGWHPGAAAQLRTPPVTDGRHFDLVRTPADSLFEAMNDHVVIVRMEWESEGRFYASRQRDQAKRDAKDASTAEITGDRLRCEQKYISVSASPQVLHGSSTGFPQLQYISPRCHP